ncbi:MAG TPA: EamA family transporter [Candidatus Binatia bacterium]|nr:EamA family transporter [Candidatus Binatia bacterium]
MVAIVGGLGAAMSWAIATLASSRSSRMIGPMSVLGWVMAVGLGVAIVPALLSPPVDLDTSQIAGLIGLGLSHNLGLLLAYRALTIGRVSIVAPITATEGGLAAVIAVALGEPLALPVAVVLAVIAIGVVLAAAERTRGDDDPARADPRHTRSAAVYALAAAFVFSIGLVLGGKLGSGGVPLAWVIVASRTVGVLLIVVPLVLRGRFRITQRALPLVLASGVLEAAGTATYVTAASQDIAIAAVLSSQFAAIAAIGGFVLFGERLQRPQVVGVAVIALGITALAAMQT